MLHLSHDEDYTKNHIILRCQNLQLWSEFTHVCCSRRAGPASLHLRPLKTNAILWNPRTEKATRVSIDERGNIDLIEYNIVSS